MTNWVIHYLSKDLYGTFQNSRSKEREGVVDSKWCVLGNEWTSMGHWIKEVSRKVSIHRGGQPACCSGEAEIPGSNLLESKESWESKGVERRWDNRLAFLGL